MPRHWVGVVGVVPGRQPGHCSANPAALGLGGGQPADPAVLPWVSRAGGVTLGLSHVELVSAVLGLWVEQLASAPAAHPPEVSGVGPQSPNLHACNWASGEHRGSLSCVHSPGAEGGGAPGAAAAAESSLTSP